MTVNEINEIERERAMILECLKLEHPNYDGCGCDNHIVCSEYEEQEELDKLSRKE
jgi:hypothetical protein